jgi:hypothetical protein
VPAREGRHRAPLAHNHQENIVSVTAPRIVAGMDDPPQGIAPRAWAIGQAQATGASLEAVYAFQVPLPVPYARVIRVPYEAVAADARMTPGHVIATQLDGHPSVRASLAPPVALPACSSASARRAKEASHDLIVPEETPAGWRRANQEHEGPQGPQGASQPGRPAASSGAATAAGAAGHSVATARETPRRHASYLLRGPYGSTARSAGIPR